MADQIQIKQFGGIDARHTRNLGNPSDGKNYIIRGGRLKTRGGCSLVDSSFTGAIKSIHSAAKVQVTTRLLVEEGANLWHRLYDSGAWANLLSNVSGNGFRSCIWQDYLIMVNGTQMMAYDIMTGTITSLLGSPPPLEHVLMWKFRIFGWAPNYAHSNYLWFCGFDNGDPPNLSMDVWPAINFLDVSGSSGTPIMTCVPYQTHILVLTQKGYWRIYGDTEEDFSVKYGGYAHIVNPDCLAVAGEMAFWLAQISGVRKIFTYTGTSPVEVSQPIEDLLQGLTALAVTNSFALGGQSQYILICPDAVAGITTEFIFDTSINEWHIHEYPVVVTCACNYGEYMHEETVHFGLSDARILELDDSATDFGNKITTEFILGPISLGGLRYKEKCLYLTAVPANDFTLNIYVTEDNQPEYGKPFTVTFKVGGITTEQVRLTSVRGQNIALRITTTDPINVLQEAELTITPGTVK